LVIYHLACTGETTPFIPAHLTERGTSGQIG
jgi:hypothetical protein